MKEYKVSAGEAGISLIKYLSRHLPAAGASLLHKQLRKKNIVLNGKKAEGSVRLSEADRICVYFSDETISKFEGGDGSGDLSFMQADPDIEVLYEDGDILAVNKPAGRLCQRDRAGGISLNEEMLAYLYRKGEVTQESLGIVRPSVCNRLDRNTSGIVLCGKTIKGLQFLSEAIRDRSVSKIYLCLVKGEFKAQGEKRGYITKDRERNISVVTEEPTGEDSLDICTVYRTLEVYEEEGMSFSLVEAQLHTGRSHQIRAQLKSLGNPICGDVKYGDERVNRYLAKNYGIRRQLLHAYRVELPDGPVIKAPVPEDFKLTKRSKMQAFCSFTITDVQV